MKPFGDKRGFTLVELMVVVAIIGVLAAMAIPDYLRFVTRVKQSEAKANLAGIYTSQTAYLAEFGNYAEGFDKLGWNPQTVNKYTYWMGDDPAAICYPLTTNDNCWETPTVIDYLPQGNDPPGVEDKMFTAVAYGNLDADAAIDTWQINDTKALKITKDDSRSLE